MENFLRLRQDHRLKTNLLYILRATLGKTIILNIPGFDTPNRHT